MVIYFKMHINCAVGIAKCVFISHATLQLASVFENSHNESEWVRVQCVCGGGAARETSTLLKMNTQTQFSDIYGGVMV